MRRTWILSRQCRKPVNDIAHSYFPAATSKTGGAVCHYHRAKIAASRWWQPAVATRVFWCKRWSLVSSNTPEVSASTYSNCNFGTVSVRVTKTAGAALLPASGGGQNTSTVANMGPRTHLPCWPSGLCGNNNTVTANVLEPQRGRGKMKFILCEGQTHCWNQRQQMQWTFGIRPQQHNSIKPVQHLWQLQAIGNRHFFSKAPAQPLLK